VPYTLGIDERAFYKSGKVLINKPLDLYDQSIH